MSSSEKCCRGLSLASGFSGQGSRVRGRSSFYTRVVAIRRGTCARKWMAQGAQVALRPEAGARQGPKVGGDKREGPEGPHPLLRRGLGPPQKGGGGEICNLSFTFLAESSLHNNFDDYFHENVILGFK